MAGPTPTSTEADDHPYVVRRYSSEDASGVRSLFGTVWDVDRSVEWIEYAYGESPYLDGPSMVVAETDGAVIGACPFVAIPMRAGSTDFLAAYFTNVMVHPDHRRRRLFTRMTRRAIEEYGDDPVSVFFCFATDRSVGGYRKLGFETFGTDPEKRVRIQNPGRVVRDRMASPLGDILGAVADGVAHARITDSARRLPR